MVRKSCGAATLIFDYGQTDVAAPQLHTLVGAFPGLAPWATSPAAPQPIASPGPIYHQLTTESAAEEDRQGEGAAHRIVGRSGHVDGWHAGRSHGVPAFDHHGWNDAG
jgi:hypothetical protein